MLRLALILTSAILLTACASTQEPIVKAEKPQYCHTTEQIVVENGEKIDSITTVECTDDNIKRLFQVRSGMAPNCGYFDYWTRIGGKDVLRKGISCQKPDGTWEVVNTSY